MYKCKPLRNARQAMFIVAVSAAVCFAVFAAASLVTELRGVLQLVGLLLLAAAIFLVVRFTLTEMEYTLTEDDFTVTKIYGNRQQAICCLDLSTVVCLIPKAEYKKGGYDKKVNIKYNGNQNIKGDSWIFICEFNGKTAAIEFEPNPPFLTIMKTFVEKAVSKRDKDKTADD